MCFIDLTKVDKLRFTDITTLLQKRNIHPNIIKVVDELNTENYMYVRAANKLGNKISMVTGIRQGYSLSPVLFNIVMDEIIKVKESGLGYRVGNKEIKIVCYADDAIIISEC